MGPAPRGDLKSSAGDGGDYRFSRSGTRIETRDLSFDDWTIEQITPWILSLIEMFGPQRCMFGSHLPIAKLSFGFDHLYDAYQHIVRDF